MRLFFFGTLMDRDLLSVVLSRPADGLHLAHAQVSGFVRRQTAEEAFPILVPQADGQVDGVVAGGIGYGDIDRLLFFEGGEYTLAELVVTTDHGRSDAHLFASTGRLTATDQPWSFNAWQTLHKGLALVEAEMLMALYGTMSLAAADAQWLDIKAQALTRYERAAPTSLAVGA